MNRLTNKTLLFANMYLGKGSIISAHLNKPVHINKKLRFSTPRRWSSYYFMPLLYAESGEANNKNNFNQYFFPKWFFFWFWPHVSFTSTVKEPFLKANTWAGIVKISAAMLVSHEKLHKLAFSVYGQCGASPSLILFSKLYKT